MIGSAAGLEIGPNKVKYLSPIAALAQRQGKLTVATLNYDNSVELMSKSHGIQCNTGIAEWSSHRSFTFDGNGISLLKLHGSIDWSVEHNLQGPNQQQRFSQYVVRQVDPKKDQKVYTPALLFGQRNKLRSEGPFSDLLGAFRRRLSESESVTIVGYSMRDDHVNEEIKRWVNLTPNFTLTVVAPYFVTNESSFAKELRRCCNRTLKIISDKAGSALAERYT